MAKNLICDIGVNDADYSVEFRSGSKKVICPIYRKWRDMIHRCYSKKAKERDQCYKDVSVCNEWLKFSNFKAWMQQQDWEGKELDKDLLVDGNKVYSPESCVFVDRVINVFLTDSALSRGSYLIGCYFDKQLLKFRARCSNPFSKKLESLGLYGSELDAHLAWKKRKHELACQLADLQTDERVAKALRYRYA
jgi:hypothetical protein